MSLIWRRIVFVNCVQSRVLFVRLVNHMSLVMLMQGLIPMLILLGDDNSVLTNAADAEYVDTKVDRTGSAIMH